LRAAGYYHHVSSVFYAQEAIDVILEKNLLLVTKLCLVMPASQAWLGEVR
jgi:hypothetical protein